MWKKLLIFLSLVGAIKAVEWNYTDIGSWTTSFPNCGGTRQSPINIMTNIINQNLRLRLVFKNFDAKPFSMTWVNNGHTAVLRSTYDSPIFPTIQNLENGETYIVDALHYHWGPNNSVGSEHTLNGFSYPIEMHIVSWNQRYGSLASAVNSTNGLLVLGNFYTVSDWAWGNYHLDYLSNIVENNTSYTLPKTFCLKYIIRQIPTRYYFYNGSLTTPTCDETVQWVVSQTPLKMTSKDLGVFRTLKGEDGNPIGSNYRPVQPLNSRSIGFQIN